MANASTDSFLQIKGNFSVVGDIPEESGWTSYLDSIYRCPALSVLSNGSCDGNDCESIANGRLRESKHRGVLGSFTNLDMAYGYTNQELVCELNHEAEIEESCGSSTLSDANSLIGRPRKAAYSFTSQRKSKRRRGGLADYGVNTVAANECLDDTATSSPSTQSADDLHPLSHLSSLSADPAEEVLERFQVLEALIPSLREGGAESSEEDMLSAIIDHVQALELRVQFLSDIWHLTHDGKHGKSLC
ncbi:hypothetical protein KP509_01G116700 [Ceratopteris richardii]|uniref:BHLH domain-containing protein n=1 Tax=Ceratopteris richardii TaxID=49495 RepID=A0A8T2VGN8_CERRI|nr:hypothetical protein KP509_01G116700 [Ceratopteris richardii]